MLALAGAVTAAVISSGSGGQTAAPLSQAAAPATTGAAGTTAPPGPPPAVGPRPRAQQPATPASHPDIPTDLSASDTTVSLPTTTAAIPPPPPPERHRRTFSVGVVDDSLAQQSPAAARGRRRDLPPRGLRHGRGHSHVDSRSDEAPAERPPRAAERRGGDARAGPAALPRRLARLLQEHAARRGRACAVRDVRRGGRQGAPGRRRRDRRQRAEPEHVLDAAVRPGRPRRRGTRVRGPARAHATTRSRRPRLTCR